MMKRILALLFCLISTSALAQTETFSTYVTGLATATSVTGAEKMFALQGGIPKTMTPYQILSNMTGDCTMASPPSIVCTKINGLTLATSATTDTTNAGNIFSGTLSLSRLALPSANLYVGNASNIPASVVLSGDCTITNAGAITCLKAGGVNLAASATTDTTNAANISSGTLASARQSAANLAASGNGGVSGVLPFANMPTGSLDQVLGYFGSTALNGIGVPNCAGALQYNTTTHIFGCGAGGGNVTNSGTPAANQYAIWTDATHIKGIAPGSMSLISVVKTQVFTASGTYTRSAGLQYATIECVGGGAAGGGVVGATGYYLNGGGGGSGGYSRITTLVGASQTITIGAAGTGSTGAAGGNGGQTSVGALCVANGGAGGAISSTGAIGTGGAGGAAGTGDIAATGHPGGNGLWQQLVPAGPQLVIQMPPGQGGSSIWGGGGITGIVGDGLTNTGAAGNQYGSGGAGCQANDVAANCAGGGGTPGYVIITEYTNQ